MPLIRKAFLALFFLYAFLLFFLYHYSSLLCFRKKGEGDDFAKAVQIICAAAFEFSSADRYYCCCWR